MNGHYPKGMFSVGNGLYAVCSQCRNVVKVNKFMFGSLHVCVPEYDPYQNPLRPQETVEEFERRTGHKANDGSKSGEV